MRSARRSVERHAQGHDRRGEEERCALEFETGGRYRRQGCAEHQPAERGTWRLETTGESGHSSQVFGELMGMARSMSWRGFWMSSGRSCKEPGLTYNVGLVLGGATAKMNENGRRRSYREEQCDPARGAGDSAICARWTMSRPTRVQAKMQAIVRDHLPKTGATLRLRRLIRRWRRRRQPRAGEAVERGERGAGTTCDGGDGSDAAWGGDIAFVAPYVPGLVGTGAMGSGLACGGRDGVSGFDSAAGEADGAADVSAVEELQ